MDECLPNLRHLRAFCEVESQKSISRGAEAVFLSQSAVTQAIAKLETIFGVPFLERVGSGVTPTTAGNVYANRVRRALAMVESGLSETIRIASSRSNRSAREILPLLTTTQLRAFVAVGTTNNFTLAARLIGSSQPSVHRSTRELESIIDVPLFEKTTRGIALTRSGQALWQQLKLAFAELNQGMADVRASSGIMSGNVVIGCMPLARHFVMPETICEFSTQHPSINIQVIESPYPDLLHALRHGDIDFLIGALRQSLPVDDVSQTPLFSAALCVAARIGHPLADKRNVSLDDLASYPWILPPTGTPTRDRFERLMSNRTQIGGLVESSSQILIRGLLMNSDRLTMISKHQVQFEIDMGQLMVLDFNIGEGLREIGLTFRSDWQPTSVQQNFLSLLRIVSERYSET